MSAGNVWSNPSKTSPSNAAQMAAFLEERSNTPDSQAVNHKLCEVTAARPGERLLEVGSGSGVLCRMLAPDLRPAGCMLGLDISALMAVRAREYARSVGGVFFTAGRAENLPFPQASFDGVIAARLFLHAADPDVILGEMKRVVKPGGRLILMDWDFGTTAVDHPNRDLTRRLLQWRNDHKGGNNWSGRQLWRMMQTAGLENLDVQTFVSIAHTEVDSLTQSLWRAAQAACEGGAITSAEQESWVKELKSRIRDGTFFASIVYFIVSGTTAPGREEMV